MANIPPRGPTLCLSLFAMKPSYSQLKTLCSWNVNWSESHIRSAVSTPKPVFLDSYAVTTLGQCRKP